MLLKDIHLCFVALDRGPNTNSPEAGLSGQYLATEHEEPQKSWEKPAATAQSVIPTLWGWGGGDKWTLELPGQPPDLKRQVPGSVSYPVSKIQGGI